MPSILGKATLVSRNLRGSQGGPHLLNRSSNVTHDELSWNAQNLIAGALLLEQFVDVRERHGFAHP